MSDRIHSLSRSTPKLKLTNIPSPNEGIEAFRADLERIYENMPHAEDITQAGSKALADADYHARHWQSSEPGLLRPGSHAHKHAVSCMFRETFNPYRPSVINWPRLDPETLRRLTSLPIWDIAVETEGKARLRMAAYAATISDPDMKDAIARNAWEENRHKEVLSRLVEAYGISIAKEPPYITPRDTEWAYMVTGFSECVDSFFAFGLFELAKCSGFFPAELVETFEPIMQEECRHILLFANWLAWYRTTIPLWKRPWFEARVFGVWLFLAWERIGMVRSMDADGNVREQDANFTVSGAKDVSSIDVSLRNLLGICLTENERRFAGYDVRLRRPRMMPFLSRCLRSVLPRSNPAPAVVSRPNSVKKSAT